MPFWLKPLSIFGLLPFTTFIESSHGFTIPSILVPSPPDAGRYTVPSWFRCQSRDCGSVVRGLLTARYLAAVPRRILLMEQQVWSVQHARQSTLRPRVADPLKAGHFMTSTTSRHDRMAFPRSGQVLDVRQDRFKEVRKSPPEKTRCWRRAIRSATIEVV